MERSFLVISSNPNAYALERAAKGRHPQLRGSPEGPPLQPAMTAALVEKLQEARIDLVVLAGFMVILTQEMVRVYPNAILNVHPALIPPSPGPGATASTSMRRPWNME